MMHNKLLFQLKMVAAFPILSSQTFSCHFAVKGNKSGACKFMQGHWRECPHYASTIFWLFSLINSTADRIHRQPPGCKSVAWLERGGVRIGDHEEYYVLTDPSQPVGQPRGIWMEESFGYLDGEIMGKYLYGFIQGIQYTLGWQLGVLKPSLYPRKKKSLDCSFLPPSNSLNQYWIQYAPTHTACQNLDYWEIGNCWHVEKLYPSLSQCLTCRKRNGSRANYKFQKDSKNTFTTNETFRAHYIKYAWRFIKTCNK